MNLGIDDVVPEALHRRVGWDTRPVEGPCAGARVFKKSCPKIPRVGSRHGGSSVAEMWHGRLSGARMDVAGDRGKTSAVIPHRANETVGAHRRNGPECRRKKDPPGVFHLHERGAGWSRTGPAHVPFPKTSI